MTKNPKQMTREEYKIWKLIEDLSEKVHKAYCEYCKEVKGEEYWTKGDYSKLKDIVKEADRYTVRAVLEALKEIGYFDTAIKM